MTNILHKKITKHIIIAGFALLILLATLSIPATVSSTNQERNISFGHPVPFVFMNSSYDLYEQYKQPYSFNFWVAFFEKEHPIDISLKNFLLSFVMIFIYIELFLLLIIHLQPYLTQNQKK